MPIHQLLIVRDGTRAVSRRYQWLNYGACGELVGQAIVELATSEGPVLLATKAARLSRSSLGRVPRTARMPLRPGSVSLGHCRARGGRSIRP